MANDCILELPRKVKNLAGQRLGRLTVERLHGFTERRRALWFCRCDCGKEKIAETAQLTKAKYPSCGCWMAEMARAQNVRHGMSHTPEHRTWLCIRRRTTDPTHRNWKHYGGRGIVVCDRWLNSFEAFFEDMGPKPSGSHTVDRIDNNGPYCKENCRWATLSEQGRNRRNNHLVEFRGEKLTIAAWTERFGFRPHRIRTLLRDGWSMERIVSTPERPPRPFKPRKSVAVAGDSLVNPTQRR